MPSNEIRAQKGVAMALTERDGMLVQWDGTTLRYTCGKPWLRGRGECWTVHHRALYVMRESEWVRVLPPLDDEPSEPAIEVGSQWRRKSDGRQCVVVSAKGSPVGNYDPQIRFEDSAAPERIDHERLRSDFTHIVTPKPDRLVDGQKLVCMETGEVVTFRTGHRDAWEILDADGRLHSVNGLPSEMCAHGFNRWHQNGLLYRENGPAVESVNRAGEVRHVYFHLGDKELTPEEWGKRIVAEYDPSKVLPEYRHLLPTPEPEPVESFDGWRQVKAGEPIANGVYYFISAKDAAECSSWLDDVLSVEHFSDVSSEGQRDWEHLYVLNGKTIYHDNAEDSDPNFDSIDDFFATLIGAWIFPAGGPSSFPSAAARVAEEAYKHAEPELVEQHPDTKALLIAKAIADLELVRDRASACRNYYTVPPSSSVIVEDFRRVADSMDRIIRTLKEATNG